mgnify:CR=1 FL=1
MEEGANYKNNLHKDMTLPKDVLEGLEDFWAKRYESEYGYLFKSVERERSKSHETNEVALRT